MFGDCEAAKPEHGGRTEQRSASDLSTQTTALLLSTRPQTDKELCSYIIYWQGIKSFRRYEIKISLNHQSIISKQKKSLEHKCGNLVLLQFTGQKKKTTKGGDKRCIWSTVAMETEYRSKQRVRGRRVMERLPKTKRVRAAVGQHLPCHHMHDM